MNAHEAALLAAWEAWDEKPSNEERAIAMVEACAALAERIGKPSPSLREDLSRHRRAGATREEALAAVLAS